MGAEPFAPAALISHPRAFWFGQRPHRQSEGHGPAHGASGRKLLSHRFLGNAARLRRNESCSAVWGMRASVAVRPNRPCTPASLCFAGVYNDNHSTGGILGVPFWPSVSQTRTRLRCPAGLHALRHVGAKDYLIVTYGHARSAVQQKHTPALCHICTSRRTREAAAVEFCCSCGRTECPGVRGLATPRAVCPCVWGSSQFLLLVLHGAFQPIFF